MSRLVLQGQPARAEAGGVIADQAVADDCLVAQCGQFVVRETEELTQYLLVVLTQEGCRSSVPVVRSA